MKIYLADIQQEMLDAWTGFVNLSDCRSADITFVSGSILGVDAQAFVSPANSFGFMDGGVDQAYIWHFGTRLQEDVQKRIQSLPMRQLFVGQTVTVGTGSAETPYLIVAPTMRAPTILPNGTDAPYMATMAAMRAAIAYQLPSVAFPGMGSGVGGVPHRIVAKQMLSAIADVLKPRAFPSGWQEAAEYHKFLTT